MRVRSGFEGLKHLIPPKFNLAIWEK